MMEDLADYVPIENSYKHFNWIFYKNISAIYTDRSYREFVLEALRDMRLYCKSQNIEAVNRVALKALVPCDISTSSTQDQKDRSVYIKSELAILKQEVQKSLRKRLPDGESVFKSNFKP